MLRAIGVIIIAGATAAVISAKIQAPSEEAVTAASAEELVEKVQSTIAVGIDTEPKPPLPLATPDAPVELPITELAVAIDRLKSTFHTDAQENIEQFADLKEVSVWPEFSTQVRAEKFAATLGGYTGDKYHVVESAFQQYSVVASYRSDEERDNILQRVQTAIE